MWVDFSESAISDFQSACNTTDESSLKSSFQVNQIKPILVRSQSVTYVFPIRPLAAKKIIVELR